MNLLITGGHLTPALAILDELLTLKPSQWRSSILYVGRKYSDDYKKSLTLEYQEINSRRIRFISINAGRATRIFSSRSLVQILKIPTGFIEAWKILSRAKPDVILTFGSYIGLPIAFCGYVMGIPVYMHEQTMYPGLANQFIGQFATQIFVSFPETVSYFDEKKTIISGNPIRRQIFRIIKKPFNIVQKKPVIYITGGSLGSQSINNLVKKILPELLTKYIVIHQTGNVDGAHDFKTLSNLKDTLPAHIRGNYYLKQYIFTDEIGYIYSVADLVIGRAGANTFFELIALQKPVLWIPLPWSANREQQRHADVFKKAGAGEVFDQSDSSENLLKKIIYMTEHIDEYQANFQHLQSLYKERAIQLILKGSNALI